MYARELRQEFVATERLKVIQESIDGLRAVSQTRRLNPLERAALDALVCLDSRARCKGSIITHEAMRWPVQIAHKAMQALEEQCLQL